MNRKRKNRSSHCGNFRSAGITRRQMLKNAACGFGSIALSALLADKSYAGLLDEADDSENWQQGQTHFAPKVKRIVYLYMDGCLLYTSPSPRDQRGSRMPSSA